MEFVVVNFPTSRRVFIDNIPQGLTGSPQGVEEGVHVFDLGDPLDYMPESLQANVTGTTATDPMPIAFTPVPLEVAVPVGASRRTRPGRRARAKRAPAAKKRKKTAMRKHAAKSSRAKKAPRKPAKRSRTSRSLRKKR
jgi:hypothetical protein